MKASAILPLASALAFSCAFSQQPAAGTDSALFSQTRSTVATDCPVGLDVRHGSLLERKLVADPPPGGALDRSPEAAGGGQRIVLSLTNLRSREIVSAQFNVHGLSHKDRYVPLQTGSPLGDLSQPLQVALSVKANGRASRDLALQRFAAITAIDVDAVTYGDGSVWHTPASGACSARPDLLMPVSATN